MRLHSLAAALLVLVPFSLTTAASAQQFEAVPSPAGALATDLEADPIAEGFATRFEGRVLLPDGAPAAGALVLSSAGGRAVADAAGDFQLEVELTTSVRELQVTATQSAGSATLSASQRVVLATLGGTNPVGGLHLAVSTTCQPDWLPTFGAAPGTNNTIRALATFTDSTGTALYVGGDFDTAGSVYSPGVAKWDGSSWSRVGNTTTLGDIHALAVYDDNTGGGPALYAGGTQGLLRWNGTTWTSVGGPVGGEIRALLVHDDGLGLGPKLFVAGDFYVQNTSVQYVGKYLGGTAWATLGSGVTDPANCLAEYDDGSGNALFVGGSFTQAGGMPANRIARWRAGAWSTLGTGANGEVKSLAVWGQSPTAVLYVGGSFSQAGGQSTMGGLARWNGASWTTPPQPTNFQATVTLAVLDIGSGPVLYATGTACNGVCYLPLRFDGSTWSYLGYPQLDAPGYAWLAHDDGSGSGPAVYFAGSFRNIAYTPGGTSTSAGCIARWNGSSWSPLGSGLGNWVRALAVHDDGLGAGPRLVAAGDFFGPGAAIANWNGTAWSRLGSGLGFGSYPLCTDLITHDDGTGPALFAAGAFAYAGGSLVRSIARWNGSTWSDLAGGTQSGELIRALASYGVGTGRKLYAGGAFTDIGGVSVNRIASWNGTSWSALGSGLNGEVYALAEFDDGSGMALYAGGSFTTAGGVTANFVAKWNGTAWSAVGTGVNNTVHVLEVLDVDGGAALYAGGDFTSANGTTALCIARWNGSSWAALPGGGLSYGPGGTVHALAAYDDGTGSGPALYAGGSFTSAGGVAAIGVARWSAGVWSPLGAGVEPTIVETLATFDDGLGQGECLYVGGGFILSSSGDSYLARWGRCAVPQCSAQLFVAPTLTLPQCNNAIGASVIAITTGTPGPGTWTLTPAPDFPSQDGWILSLTQTGPQSASVGFWVTDTSTAGTYTFDVTWTGTCDGAPVTASRTVTCVLQMACPPGVPYCFGDGSGTACPCGNASSIGANVGCENSLLLGGKLRATGSPSIAGDTLVLRGSQMPDSSALYYQGTAQQSGGAGAVFGDGLRCVAGTTVRLGTKTNTASASSYPSGADASVSARGGVVAPGSRVYQIWYRNAAAFCSPSVFNLTNGLEVTWRM